MQKQKKLKTQVQNILKSAQQDASDDNINNDENDELHENSFSVHDIVNDSENTTSDPLN